MGLQTFHPTPGQLPGRSNLVEAGGLRAIIDYGHNVPALQALDELVRGLPARHRIAVASAPGNRRDADLIALGEQLGRMHDRLYVCESDPRGRAPGDAARLIRQGAAGTIGSGHAEIIMAEADAVDAALAAAAAGDLLVLLIDDTDRAIRRLKATAGAGAASPVVAA
jgi:cyanophycin synthetase